MAILKWTFKSNNRIDMYTAYKNSRAVGCIIFDNHKSKLPFVTNVGYGTGRMKYEDAREWIRVTHADEIN